MWNTGVGRGGKKNIRTLVSMTFYNISGMKKTVEGRQNGSEYSLSTSSMLSAEAGLFMSSVNAFGSPAVYPCLSKDESHSCEQDNMPAFVKLKMFLWKYIRVCCIYKQINKNIPLVMRVIKKKIGFGAREVV